MINYLHIGIWLVCFYDAIILLLLPSTVDIFFPPDGSTVRYVVNILAVGVGMLALMSHGFRCIPSRAIALFILAMIISAVHSPNISMESTFMPHDAGIFNYKPMFEVLVFFLMFMGIYSLNFDARKMVVSLSWIGAIYGTYIVFQHIGLDQLYQINLPGDGEINHLSRNPESGGFINQPVFAGALLAMLLPFAIKTKNYWSIAFSVLGILCTANRSALLGAIIGVIFIFRSKWASVLAWIVVGAVIAIIMGSFVVPSLVEHTISTTGRSTVWHDAIKSFFNNPFPGIHKGYILTGLGLGSFSVIFPFYNHSGFMQAHLEMLEVIWCMGIAGAVAMYFFGRDIIAIKGDKYIGAGLLAIFICSMFNPVWHIPQLQFLSVLLLALYFKGESYDLENRTA